MPQWGADESLRTCTPTTRGRWSRPRSTTPTRSTRTPPDEVAGLVRGIYAYHTRAEAAGGRGWCDIGYNALVDRFGRIFEGRGGSFDESVVGVHTGGFNSRTFGVSVIGDFSSDGPRPVDPRGGLAGDRVEVRHAAHPRRRVRDDGVGRRRLEVPRGHGGDVPHDLRAPRRPADGVPGPTAVRPAPPDPGARVRARQRRGQRVPALELGVDQRPTRRRSRSPAGHFDPESTASLVVDVQVDRVSHGFLADRPRPDVGAAYPGAGSAHGFVARVPVAPGHARRVPVGAERRVGQRPAARVQHVTVANRATGRLRRPGDDHGVHASGRGLGARHRHHGARSRCTCTRTASSSVAVTANVAARATSAAAYPALGSAHGFSVGCPIAAGTHTVCAYAINDPAGYNPTIGCRTVTVVGAARR